MSPFCRITDVRVNEGARIARADEAVHAVTFFGDTTGNGDYSGLDAVQIARVVVGLDTGFEAFPRIDPVLIADITGNGDLSGLDAVLVAQEVVGLDPPEIPPLPSGQRPSGAPASVAAAFVDFANAQTPGIQIPVADPHWSSRLLDQEDGQAETPSDSIEKDAGVGSFAQMVDEVLNREVHLRPTSSTTDKNQVPPSGLFDEALIDLLAAEQLQAKR